MKFEKVNHFYLTNAKTKGAADLSLCLVSLSISAL